MPDAVPSLEEECFFIAPIGKEGSPERARSDGVLDFIIRRAADELGLTALRGDHIGEPGQITLQVIDHILGARAAVADLTGLNPNVFYELAVRHTARLPVALIAEGHDLPFDIAQMRTIFFDHRDLRSADQCRQAVVTQLREALDKGAVDSPIATSVDVRAMQSGSVAERSIAELITTIEEMSQSQRRSAAELTHTRVVVRKLYERANLGEEIKRALNATVDYLMRLKHLIDERADLEIAKELAIIEGRIEQLFELYRARRRFELDEIELLFKRDQGLDIAVNSRSSADNEIPLEPSP